jgi:tetratricopeptide (TPR) repeat protein
MRLNRIVALVLLSIAAGYGQDCTTLDTCQQLLKARPKSSIAHHRTGEIYLAHKQYQQAANAFHGALEGDSEPKWVVAWSYVSLGKVFDVTRSRDRAVHFYRLALATKDNTRGATDEASKYLQTPFTQN